MAHSKETRRKISISHKKLKLIDEKCCAWKGDKAGELALHNWVKKHKQKPKWCEDCKKEKKLELANIRNHKYTRNPDDYRWLCLSCHSKIDDKINNIKSKTAWQMFKDFLIKIKFVKSRNAEGII